MSLVETDTAADEQAGRSWLTRIMGARLFLTTVVGFVVALLVATIALPHDPYIRYQLLRNTLHARAVWVYERIHFDPTPIDVVIVGPSRSASGVDAPMLSKILSDRLGRKINVVNFSFSQRGEDLSYAIVKETFKAKQPKLVIDAVIEQQERGGHPAFRDLADVGDILGAPIVFNKSYLANLARLPFRQLQLAFDTAFASAVGFSRNFDSSAYIGSDLPRRHFPWREPDAAVPRRDLPAAYLEKDIEAASRAYASSLTKPILPAFLRANEFAVARHSYETIRTLVDRHGAKLILLYQPYYKGPAEPFDARYYDHVGPILNPAGVVKDDAANYEDVAHFSDQGARKLTEWLGQQLVPYLSSGK